MLRGVLWKRHGIWEGRCGRQLVTGLAVKGSGVWTRNGFAGICVRCGMLASPTALPEPLLVLWSIATPDKGPC